MLRTRTRRKTTEARRAVVALAEVTTSVQALNDEDLLDLADIFRSDADATLSRIASTEMKRRGIGL